MARRNLLYSMALACVMLLFLIGYFIYMLPSLYVDYVMEQNLRSIRQQHDSYIANGTYEGVQVKNSTACFSFEIPMEGNSVLITNKAFSAEINITDGRLIRILEQYREKFGKAGGMEDVSFPDVADEMEQLAEVFKETVQADALPVEVNMLYNRDMDGEFHNETIKVHAYSDSMVIIQAGIEDSNNKYTNYIAVEKTADSLVLSFLPVVTPEMDEIRPIVLQSLPMLGAVIVLIVLLFSQLYSKGIVSPIVELVQHAQKMRYARDFSVERLSVKWTKKEDEVKLLADTLDDFYQQVREGYHKLEAENERRKIFLRASSHQLKTPIAAALLLVDGMINEIGRYKDTKMYLPKVKEQLLAMRKMVEDILYLDRCADSIQLQQVELGGLLRRSLRNYQVAITEKQLVVDLPQEGAFTIYSDEMIVGQVLDNLLSNAVKYTPPGGRIEIAMGHGKNGGQLKIENFGVTISEEILPHIFEPFVSGTHEEAAGMHSHGLGLYIASFYAGKLGVSVKVCNHSDSVAAMLIFKD